MAQSQKQFVKTNDGTLYILIDGDMNVVGVEHPKYNEILLNIGVWDTDRILEVIRDDKAVDCMTTEIDLTFYDEYDNPMVVKRQENTVEYKGVIFTDEGLVNRIYTLVQNDYDTFYITQFIQNLVKNPSYNSVTQMFKFISKHGFPITTEGKLLGYKAIRKDGYDIYSGKVKNEVGSYVEMTRCMVDDDEQSACSKGLHIGTLEYALGYGYISDSPNCNNKIILVEFSPEDVVSVPKCETNKLRCCKYRVVANYNGRSVLSGQVYTPEGELIVGKDFQNLFNGKLPYEEFLCSYNDDYDDYEDDWEEDDSDDYDEWGHYNPHHI